MKLFASLFLLFTIIGMAGHTYAGGVLTLDDCIRLALQNRASIIAAQGAENLAKADQLAALGAFLPRVDASYRYGKTKSRNIKSDFEVVDSALFVARSVEVYDPVGDSTFIVQGVVDSVLGRSIREFELPDQDRTSKSLNFTAQLSVFNLPNVFNYASSKAYRAKAHLDVIGAEQDLILSVKVSYYKYLAFKENISVQKEAVARSKEQLKLIQSKYDLGSASRSDLLKQKVRLGNDQLALLEAQNSVTTGKAELAYTIGIDPNSDVEFSTDYKMNEISESLQEAMAYGLEHKPSVLSINKLVDAVKNNKRMQKAGYLPTLSAFGTLGYSDGTRGDTVTFNQSDRSTTIGFQVNWNIFDGFWRERKVTSAKVDYNNALARRADERNLTAQRIKTAYLDIQRLKEKKSVSKENVEAAEEDLKITQEKYNLGAATILDLLDAQVSLKQAQVSLIQADFDLNLAIAELNNAMGKR